MNRVFQTNLEIYFLTGFFNKSLETKHGRPKGAFTYDIRCIWAILTCLPTYLTWAAGTFLNMVRTGSFEMDPLVPSYHLASLCS